MAILNFGSLNIDHVYTVEHVVRPGQTVASRDYRLFAGGKGGNQSAALALAGAPVAHAGRVGTDGGWLVDGLRDLGVDVTGIVVDQQVPTGHAVIQVEAGTGQNAIFLFPGCNQAIAPDQIETAISGCTSGDMLLLQNEISSIPQIVDQARARGLSVVLNPAPCSEAVRDYPLRAVDLLIVNESEAAALAGTEAGDGIDSASPPRVEALIGGVRPLLAPDAELLLTLGEHGAVLDGARGRRQTPALTAGPAIDTTAAGDTFIGYFLAARVAGADDETCLRRAAAAAALCVTRAGARAAIPTRAEVDQLLEEIDR